MQVNFCRILNEKENSLFSIDSESVFRQSHLKQGAFARASLDELIGLERVVNRCRSHCRPHFMLRNIVKSARDIWEDRERLISFSLSHSSSSRCVCCVCVYQLILSPVLFASTLNFLIYL